MSNEVYRSQTPEQRLKHAIKKLTYHRNTYIYFPSNSRLRKIYKWTTFAARAVFDLHPELREEGLLPRYFVAKAGRKQKLSGCALTSFVDEQYVNGTWWKLVPEDVLKGNLTAPPAQLSDGTRTGI